ncbi:MAG: hypothetical protein EOP45_17340 [Sphingobacteriaceae bacterium]|nr:MAG: hypothetical protein EOP45_17340 [Sphingobacteriaceae bacterium]
MAYQWSLQCDDPENPIYYPQMRARAKMFGIDDYDLLSGQELCDALDNQAENYIEEADQCINKDGDNLDGDSFSEVPPGFIFSVLLDDERRICYDIRDLARWINHTSDRSIRGEPRMSPGREYELTGELEDTVLKRARVLLSKEVYRDVFTKNYDFIHLGHKHVFRILHIVSSVDRRHNTTIGNLDPIVRVQEGTRVKTRYLYSTRNPQELTSTETEAEKDNVLNIIEDFVLSIPNLSQGTYRMIKLMGNSFGTDTQNELVNIANEQMDDKGHKFTFRIVQPHSMYKLEYKRRRRLFNYIAG